MLYNYFDKIYTFISVIENDPTYVPLKPTGSKIPVKSSSSMKFDKAHRKEFNKSVTISCNVISYNITLHCVIGCYPSVL